MTDKDFLFKIAFAELAYATNLRTAGYTQNQNLPDIWYSEKYYAKVKEIAP